jgi:hypothetical protein
VVPPFMFASRAMSVSREAVLFQGDSLITIPFL